MRKKIATTTEVPLESKLETMIGKLQEKVNKLDKKLTDLKYMKDKWEHNISLVNEVLETAQHVVEPMETLKAQAQSYASSISAEITLVEVSLSDVTGQKTKLKDALSAMTYEARSKELAVGVQERLQALDGSSPSAAQLGEIEIGSSVTTINTAKMDAAEVLQLLFTAQATIELTEEVKVA